jgi:PAS domain S-box-containing protein
MNLIQHLHFFCFLVLAVMSVYITYKDPKALLNRLCAMLLASFSIWNFVDIITTADHCTREIAILFQAISSIGWISFASILLGFSLVYSKNEKLLHKKWFLILVFFFPIIAIIGQITMGILGYVIKGTYGWEFRWEANIWVYIFYSYYFSFTLFAIYNIYLHKLKTTSTLEKNQAKIMVATLLISLIAGSITDVIIPMFKIQGVPQIADVTIIIFAGGMIYSIVKYKFFIVTPALAAENIISTMDELLILLDSEGNILTVNNSVLETLGYDQNELMGNRIEMLFGQDQSTNSPVERIVTGMVLKDLEIGLLSKDSKTIPVILSSTSTKNKEDKISGIVIVARNITEQKRSEEMLIESEGKVRAKLDAILLPDGDIENLDLADIIDLKRIQKLMDNFYQLTKMGVAILNIKGEVLVATGWQDICTKFHRVHPATCKNCAESDKVLSEGLTSGSFRIYKCKNNMWDISTPIIIGGKHFGNLFLGQFLFDDEVPDYDLFRAQAKQYGFDEEEYMAALERIPRWSHETVDTVMKFYTDAVNMVSALSYSNIKLAQSLSEQRRIETDMETAKEKAEESDRLKSAFLANMSHEIRTPMNGILGFAEQLKTPDLAGERQQEYIRIIEISGKRMLNIINDIISISKIEAGQIEVNISETNINEQIQFLYNFFKPEVERSGIQLFYKNSLPTKEAFINTDREKVYAILTNLIKNAIKFTFYGSIEFGYHKKSNSENSKDSELEFFVKDTGEGIRDEQKNIIFERFRQGSESHIRNYDGAGLGLSISKAYVESLGGKIWVESELGKGSTFYFTIPCRSEPEIPEVVENIASASEIENKIHSLKILIVEDDETSEMLISLIIEKICKEVLKVRSGFEAVETCRKNPDIDIVLMDIQMSEMNGYEAMDKIREFNKDMIIIAQTAYALSGERERAMEAGFNDYISKPILKGELLRIIQEHIK